MIDFILSSIETEIVTHDTVGMFLIMTSIVSWLLMWFLLRAELILYGRWFPPRRSIGWALAHKLFWEGMIEGAIGVLVMFGTSQLPIWGIIIVVGLFLASMQLFKVYAEVEIAP